MVGCAIGRVSMEAVSRSFLVFYMPTVIVLLAAMHAQLDKLASAHTSFFTTQVAEELGADLIAYGPPGTSHVYFASGGSEGMEAALEMARQYLVEIGETHAGTSADNR